HLTPMIRGIHSTLYAQVPDRSVDLQQLFEERYANEPFVDVLPAGSHPETRSVRGANVCRLAVHRPQGGDLVVVLSVIDNPVTGASGQGIQHMNIALGLAERMGLEHPALMTCWPLTGRKPQNRTPAQRGLGEIANAGCWRSRSPLRSGWPGFL